MIDTKMMIEYTKELTVLYVEDDLTLLENTLELFSNYFKSVDTAVNGQDGFEKYIAFEKENSFYYDLVIADINMPKLNGLDMAQKIYAKNSMQAIIITTAHNENEYLVKAIELGVDGFITKPIESTALNKVLYKTSQAIGDHKFVLSHVEMIENLNIQLEEQNNQLITKNKELEKSFRMLDTMVHKEQLKSSKNSAQEVLHVEITSEEKEHKIQQIQDLVNSDLFELKEILTEIDVNVIEIINNSENISSVELPTLVALFSQYASVLRFYNFFDDLGFAMSNFAITIKDNPLPQNQENIQNIFMLLESFIYVLSKWHEDIASGDSSKINQFDASIISDIQTISNMWILGDAEASNDNLDDIFDF